MTLPVNESTTRLKAQPKALLPIGADARRDSAPRTVDESHVQLRFTGRYRMEAPAKEGGKELMLFELENGQELSFERYSYTARTLRGYIDEGHREIPMVRVTLLWHIGSIVEYELRQDTPKPAAQQAEENPVVLFQGLERTDGKHDARDGAPRAKDESG